jgi:hypothetical protein
MVTLLQILAICVTKTGILGKKLRREKNKMGVRSGTTNKTFAVNKNRLLQTTVYRELLTKPQPKGDVMAQ